MKKGVDFEVYKCPCEKQEHVISLDIPVWKYFYETVQELGEVVPVQTLENGKKYAVPRIYIAVHGLRAKDLPFLSFPEVK